MGNQVKIDFGFAASGYAVKQDHTESSGIETWEKLSHDCRLRGRQSWCGRLARGRGSVSLPQGGICAVPAGLAEFN